jgi:hypothetical protein
MFRYFPFEFAETNSTVKGFPTEFVDDRIGVADPDIKAVVNVSNIFGEQVVEGRKKCNFFMDTIVECRI